ncbi:MAG: hypothetical protein HY048_09540 [Acidobacteria bacterium]|nr:hypothetical protein [Acidobacteriota bacterium]
MADGSLSLGDDRLNWELAALQLRMVLELIAFASLCAHKDTYAAVHANFAKHWKASLLLKELASMHPDFYPKPVRFDHIKEGGVRHFARVDGFLTQEEFVRLYDVCSQVIHTANPFGELKPIDFGLSVAAWVERIQALLDTHFIRLYGNPQLWVVQMGAGTGGSVHVAVAEPKPAV